MADEAGVAALETRARERNARAAVRAAEATDPDPADVLKYMYTDTAADEVPAASREVVIYAEPPVASATRTARSPTATPSTRRSSRR